MGDGRTTIVLPSVNESDAIVELTLSNLSLSVALTQLAEEKDALEAKVVDLEKKLRSSVPMEYFSSLIERMVKKGDIPVPKEILQFNLPVGIWCEPGDVYVQQDGVFVLFTFDSNGYSRPVRFKFVPTPTWEGIYPDFHMGYEKQKVIAPRKPRTRKKKLDSVPLVAP